jgi:hypothetical protein
MEAWTGTARGRGSEALGGGLLAAGLASLFTSIRAAGPILALVGVVAILVSRLRVHIDDTGLTVDPERWSWPRVHLPIEDIDAVTSLDVRPWRVGGWGYRGSLLLFRRAAWVVRAGPGLRVDLTGGRRFWVTVDDAPAAAAVLGRLLTPRPG